VVSAIDETVYVIAPLLVSPSFGAQDVDPTHIWFQIDKVGETAGFDLQVADNIDFNNPVLNIVNLGGSSYEYIGGLEFETTYYWRARVQGSEWSEISQFETKSEHLASPVLQSPTNDSNVEVIITLAWIGLLGVSDYKVQVAKDASFNNLSVDTAVSSESLQVSLEQNTLYYWRVAGIDDFGQGSWSETWTFTTGLEGAGESWGASAYSESIALYHNIHTGVGDCNLTPAFNDARGTVVKTIINLIRRTKMRILNR
jgi:hypothetical protein